MLLSQVENMKATSHCGSIRGGIRSLERQTLSTREVTGRQRRDRTGACVPTSTNPGTRLRSHQPHRTGSCLLSALQAVEHSWFMSTTWTSESTRMCASHNLRLHNTSKCHFVFLYFGENKRKDIPLAVFK